MAHDSFAERPQQTPDVPPAEAGPRPDISLADVDSIVGQLGGAQEVAQRLRHTVAMATVLGSTNHGRPERVAYDKAQLVATLQAALALLEKTK